MPKEKSLIVKYAVLTEDVANSLDINDPKKVMKLRMFDDIDEAKGICKIKQDRHPESKYDVYVLKFEIYLFKKYKEGETKNE